MSGIPSNFSENDFLYFVIPAGIGLTAACIVYTWCFRLRRNQQQRSNQGIRRGDSDHESSPSNVSQRGTVERDVRFNLEYRHFPSNSIALNSQVRYTHSVLDNFIMISSY